MIVNVPKIPGGFFISVEGGEGVGKTTHMKLLQEKLNEKGFGVVCTREPGGTAFGNKLRFALLVDEEHISEETRLLLFEGSRRHNTENVIMPALKEGNVVISDRYAASSIAYQGHGSGISIDVIEKFNDFATCGLKPDVTFVIDIDSEEGLKRTVHNDTGSPDIFTSKSLEFHKKVNNAYIDLAKKNPERFVLVDFVEGDLEGMNKKMFEIVKKRIDEKMKGE